MLALCVLAWSACGTLSMKPPESKAPLKKLAVQGHSPSRAARDRELSIGSARVSDVAGTVIYPPGLTAYGRMPEQTLWDYHYNVRDGQSALRGECIERVGETRYYGLGETTLDLTCRCFAGQKPVSELSLAQGEGRAILLPAHRFAVFGTRGSQQGRRAREILGYRFKSGRSVGAIDVTKASGAYFGDNLTREEQDALTCLYAGILLHRASR
jgi:hypothetical protein